jgi:methyl-accepting chemotaxis protein
VSPSAAELGFTPDEIGNPDPDKPSPMPSDRRREMPTASQTKKAEESLEVKAVLKALGMMAKGDLSQAMSLENEGVLLKGEFLRTAKTINTMVEPLSSLAAEVTRVAREVGTQGKLGGQAQVKGVIRHMERSD